MASAGRRFEEGRARSEGTSERNDAVDPSTVMGLLAVVAAVSTVLTFFAETPFDPADLFAGTTCASSTVSSSETAAAPLDVKAMLLTKPTRADPAPGRVCICHTSADDAEVLVRSPPNAADGVES